MGLGYDVMTSPSNPLDGLLHGADPLSGSSALQETAAVANAVSSGVNLGNALSGEEVGAIIRYAKTSFDDTVNGWIQGYDPIDARYKWLIGDATSSIDWNVTAAGTLTINGAGLVSPTISYGKTSFSDSVNAGYWIGTEGIYVGAASDASKMKYNVSTGLFEFKGDIAATSGYFGNATNGITIDSTGATITGSGYFRTNTTGARLELVKSLSGGYTSALVGYNSANDVFYRLSADGGDPYLIMFSRGQGCVTLSDVLTTTTGNMLTVSVTGLNDGIDMTISGSTARSSNYGILLTNNAVNGSSLKIAHGDDNDADMVVLSPNAKKNNAIVVSDTSLTATHEARITNEGYLQFPAYFHCSDFDEYLASDTVLASSVIAKSYWVGGGTSGTQTLITGNAQDQNTYIALSTTSTANRSSSLTFGRFIDPLNQSCLEFRFRISSKTNTTFQMGFYADATHYFLLEFDSATDPDHLFVKSNNGSSSGSTDTAISVSTIGWHTFRVSLYASNGFKAYFDDSLLSAGTQYTGIGHAKPYVYVDNNDQAEEKTLYLDYVKIWSGRDNTSVLS